MQVVDREAQEQREAETLAPEASHARDTEGRQRSSEPDALRAFLFDRVYTAPAVMAEVEKATHLLNNLFDYYVDRFDEVPDDYRAISDGDNLRAVADYIAGMTDRFATSTYERLFIPHALSY